MIEPPKRIWIHKNASKKDVDGLWSYKKYKEFNIEYVRKEV